MPESSPKAAVIGWPIDHSRSPLIHCHWLRTLGLTGDYTRLAIAPDDIAELKSILRQGGYRGCNVTIPHKEAAFRLADHVDPVAEKLEAANTLWFEDGQLHASNTDGFGFLANLDDLAPGWDKSSNGEAGKAIVLGAGGAARAVIWALMQREFDPIIVVNRTLEKAEILSDHFGSGQSRKRVIPMSQGDVETAIEGADFLVNTTSIGMNGATDFEFSLVGLKETAIVCDIVYTPLETGLLRRARAQNLHTADGLGMLLHQAVPGFEKWFGVRPTVTSELRQMIIDQLGASA